jgi:hypothetical protein
MKQKSSTSFTSRPAPTTNGKPGGAILRTLPRGSSDPRPRSHELQRETKELRRTCGRTSPPRLACGPFFAAPCSPSLQCRTASVPMRPGIRTLIAERNARDLFLCFGRLVPQRQGRYRTFLCPLGLNPGIAYRQCWTMGLQSQGAPQERIALGLLEYNPHS